jgi:hypothetical protein
MLVRCGDGAVVGSGITANQEYRAVLGRVQAGVLWAVGVEWFGGACCNGG